ANHGRAFANPEQIGVTDFITCAIRHHQAKWLKRLLTQHITEFFCGHESHSLVSFTTPTSRWHILTLLSPRLLGRLAVRVELLIKGVGAVLIHSRRRLRTGFCRRRR